MALPKKCFAILGSGLQGTAAGYDLAKFAEPQELRFLDASEAQARRAADDVRRLTGFDRVTSRQVDAKDPDALRQALEGVDVLLSCVPFHMHPAIERIALARGVSVCDLGGNTDITRHTLSLHDLACENEATVVPDCGLAPGLVVSLGLALYESLGADASIGMYCGVLPQHPKGPLGYKSTFNIEGLVTEYDHEALVLRNGELVYVDTLTELETLDSPLGALEAFVTSGGASTAPETLKGKVKDFAYKTLRYPGHGNVMRTFKEAGFWRRDPVSVDGISVSPLKVFCALFDPYLKGFEDEEVCVVMAIGSDASGARKRYVIVDRSDPATGFSAMQRLTGFSLSIVAMEIAAGRVEKGAVRYENAMKGLAFVERLRLRGVVIDEKGA